MRWRVDPCTVLLVLWGLFIIYGTLFPFAFASDIRQALTKLHQVGETLNHRASRTDIVSNVLLFLPWGALFSFRCARRGAGIWVALLGATLSGVALSGMVETFQLFTPTRVTSLVDVATNTAGAALGGFAGWGFARRFWPQWSPRLTRLVSMRPITACALAAAAGLVIAGLSPFDVSIDMGDLRAALKRAQPVPFGRSLGGDAPMAEPWSWAQEGLTAVLAGGLFGLAMKEAGKRNLGAVAASVALGGGLALAIEMAQLAIPGRVADMTTVFFTVIGSAIGAAIVCFGRERAPRQWVTPALVVWALALALAAWTPPRLAAPGTWLLEPWQLVPFWSYYWRTDVYALADLANQVMSFIPLGALLAAGNPRLRPRRAFAVGLVIGLVLEIGQVALADRTAEITDALSGGAGALLGTVLWRSCVALRTSAAGHARYRVPSFSPP
jgi:glycopeptide antibiotics resistance protein